MNNYSEQITQFIIQQFNQRVLEESVPRILQCFEQLSDKELWRKPNSSSNSVANLVIHLMGNAKQYIICGIGGMEDHRERSKEFLINEIISKEELAKRLSSISNEMKEIVQKLSPGDLVQLRDVQCYHMSVTAILIHVIEHFSYHTGQIVYFTKALKDVDLAFYGNMDLEKKGKD